MFKKNPRIPPYHGLPAQCNPALTTSLSLVSHLHSPTQASCLLLQCARLSLTRESSLLLLPPPGAFFPPEVHTAGSFLRAQL